MDYYNLSKKQRVGCLLLTILIISIAAAMNFIYRPYIYSNGINDWHIADSFSNFLGVPAAHFFILSLKKRVEMKLFVQILVICLSFTFYEFFIGLTFDIYDIFATILSGFCTFFIVKKTLESGRNN